MTSRILIVEDEAPQAEMLAYNLEKQGFEVAVVSNGEDGLALVHAGTFDAVVLDWMLPDVSGIEVCRQLRSETATRAVPILMLTARGEEEDRVRGFETGADDYLVKPYSVRELIARINALLRRANPDTAQDVISFADIEMDMVRHKVHRDGVAIHLGPKEFKLLKVMLERPGRVFSREQLLDRVWGNDVYVEHRTVDVHIRRLRKALNSSGRADLLRTVRGEGYAVDQD